MSFLYHLPCEASSLCIFGFMFFQPRRHAGPILRTWRSWKARLGGFLNETKINSLLNSISLRFEENPYENPPSVRENEIIDLKPLRDIHIHFYFDIFSICDGPKTLAPFILFNDFIFVTLGTLGHIISLSIAGMRLATLILFGAILGPYRVPILMNMFSWNPTSGCRYLDKMFSRNPTSPVSWVVISLGSMLGDLGTWAAEVVEGNQHINLRPLDFIEPKTTQNFGPPKYCQGPGVGGTPEGGYENSWQCRGGPGSDELKSKYAAQASVHGLWRRLCNFRQIGTLARSTINRTNLKASISIMIVIHTVHFLAYQNPSDVYYVSQLHHYVQPCPANFVSGW